MIFMTNKKLGLLLLPLVSLSAIGLVEVVRVISAPTPAPVICESPSPVPLPQPPPPTPKPAPTPHPAPVA